MEHWREFEVNSQGHLMIDNIDAVELAKEYGTPLYVMEENKIRQICRGYTKTLQESGMDGMVLYASKAFLTTAMCKIIESEGMGLDVVSAGELYTALHANFPTEKLYLHGNNKTEKELTMAVEAGLGAIVIDGLPEMDKIQALAQKAGKIQRVLLRIKPGIDAHTHDYIKTAKVDSKFGFGLKDGTADDAVKKLMSLSNLELAGLHCHIGSQIFETQPFADAVDILLDYACKIMEDYRCSISEINVGGGYGIHYLKEDDPLLPQQYAEVILKKIREGCVQRGIGKMRVVIEPGRSVVGEAGTTLYTIGTIKEIPGIRTYVSVDGGMTDNPRPALYQAKYTAAIINKANKEADACVSIAGRCCESGDMLIWDIKLPKAEPGDILAVFSTGAYNYSMASNYNKVPHAAVVLVKDGKSDLIVRRQTLQQLVQNDEIPSWLI